MALTLWKPFDRLLPFSRDFDQAIDSFWSTPFFDVTSRSMAPPLEVKEDDSEIRVKLELAGVDEKDISITLSDGNLQIKGEKKEEREEKSELCYCSERNYGSFERTIGIPSSVDPENVTAKFKNGVLMVTLPKKEEAKPKNIEIEIK
jgi:HSP20 family protein